jgi:hypothetical protein
MKDPVFYRDCCSMSEQLIAGKYFERVANLGP